jgi:membrane fusion protein, multidrug efflux system
MEQQQPKKKKSPVRYAIILMVVCAASYFAWQKISFTIGNETTDNAQVETQIIPVLPRVPGYIKSIAVKDYDSVNAGQLIVELDDAELQTQLLQMQADYNAAVADIANADATLTNAKVSTGTNKGNISLANIKLQQAQEDYKRNQDLYAEQAITKKQLDDSRFALDQAQQNVSNSKSDLGTADSKIDVQQAAVQKAYAALEVKKAALAQQQLKISYTKIYAPQKGKLGKRNISEGQYVQAGTPLFSIVNDTAYWIVANFKETQIKKFHPGMPVQVSLDAYPDEQLTGTIESLSDATGAKFSLLPPDNSSGNFVKVTQRVPVKIKIDNAAKYNNILRAGLSAEIIVPIN